MGDLGEYPRTFIQYTGPVGEIVNDDLFITYLLRYIERQNISVSKLFQDIREDIFRLKRYQKEPYFVNRLPDNGSMSLYPVEIKYGT